MNNAPPKTANNSAAEPRSGSGHAPARPLRAQLWILLAVSVPFTVLHLLANPDDAPISLVQHLVAAVANFFGPWGVAVVRCVDFPNAGWREFNLPWSVGLTLAGVALLAAGYRFRGPAQRLALLAGWGLFALAWFLIGFFQIASGLL